MTQLNTSTENLELCYILVPYYNSRPDNNIFCNNKKIIDVSKKNKYF